ncbi:thioredoxin-disulfide reductase [Propionimicrobium sp. PCR01-08-3]|uniref:thioredoxin-disulfide reductase n=1 Tax=Propionimicrobium sp. PCR01-08-3 TaxID=3052086 RepID=UPI00255C980D|nr:thioredoxin-disulfide reductase [Propionimicrobium sp. PCR01-08-3]WIY82603.1 thioredoxin-disulfide reductase [Propionimicrobium sp. PCR01-08-3]
MTTNPFAGGGLTSGIQLDGVRPASLAAPVEVAADAPVRDIIIVGSGPAGYTAAIYAARDGMHPVVLEGSIDAGGALMTTTEVENFPGFPEGIQGPDLMANMRAQAERFGAELITDDATSLELTADIKKVTDTDGNVYLGRAVILAMGSAYRRLNISGEDLYSGKGISWCATCDGFFYKGKDIAVVGGGDSAAEEATYLTRFANSVTLIHRRDQLRASKIMADRVLSDPKITPAWNSQIVSFAGSPTLQELTLRDTKTGQLRTLPVAGLFEAIGHEPRSALVAGQVELDDQGYVLVDGSSTLTNLAGVFACGDLVDHTYRQAITAAGTGCRAALDAEEYLALLSDAAKEPALIVQSK